jgi:transposase
MAATWLARARRAVSRSRAGRLLFASSKPSSRLFELLRAEGYQGAYDSVQRHVRAWRRARSQQGAVFIPLWFAPGEAYQFDWSHEVVVLGGVTTTVKVAHLRLCHSRMFLARAYPRETQEMVFAAHDRAFRLFGGACRRGIYDNMTTAVDAVFLGSRASEACAAASRSEAPARGKERRFNRRFLRMCSHYLVDPVACTPASGWEKGQSPPRRKPGSRTRSAISASTCLRRGCALPAEPVLGPRAA